VKGHNRGRYYRHGTGYANFYEKALFVKGRRGGPAVWLTQLLCPSRYASIRTRGELTLFVVARCIG
jgi:hypothetical protein